MTTHENLSERLRDPRYGDVLTLRVEAADALDALTRERDQARSAVNANATVADRNRRRAEAAEAKVEALTEALQFYAAGGNYLWDMAPDPVCISIPGTSRIDGDQGFIARCALEGKDDDLSRALSTPPEDTQS